VIRSRYYNEQKLVGSPQHFPSAPINTRGYPDTRFTLQIYLEDCTGCGLCVEACPVHSPVEAGHQGDQHGREAADPRT
jgi:pyruvate-ferredoxin/flavodoxin oxidoreductase